MDFSPLSPGSKSKKLALDMGSTYWHLLTDQFIFSIHHFFPLWTYRTFCFLLKYISQFTYKRMTFVVTDKLKSLSDKRVFLHRMDLVLFIYISYIYKISYYKCTVSLADDFNMSFCTLLVYSKGQLLNVN